MNSNIKQLVDELLRQKNETKFDNSKLERNTIVIKWSNRQPSEVKSCKEVYMLTDDYGNRDNNIGAYYGELLEGGYIIKAQGTKLLHDKTGIWAYTEPEYYSDIYKAAERVVELTSYLYHIKTSN